MKDSNQFDIDFTQLSTQQFWVLWEVVKRWAPGPK